MEYSQNLKLGSFGDVIRVRVFEQPDQTSTYNIQSYALFVAFSAKISLVKQSRASAILHIENMPLVLLGRTVTVVIPRKLRTKNIRKLV